MKQLATIPDMAIEIGGSSLPAEMFRSLSEIRVQHRLSLPSLCELTFFNPTDSLADHVSVSVGSALKVTAVDDNRRLFAGEVTAIEYCYNPSNGREVHVRGYDSLHRLRKRQPVRTHVQVTILDLARELVGDLGITATCDDPGPIWQRIAQYGQSDFDLLLEVAERCGLYFTLREDVLRLVTLEGTGEAIPLALGDALLEARLEVNSEAACRSVTVAGWDPLRAARHEGKASSPRVGRDVTDEAPPSQVGGTGERVLVDETVQNDRQAEMMAQAELDFRAAREVTLWGVAEGSPDLMPGAIVEIKRVADNLAGKYVLTSVNHLIDPIKGFVSEIATAPPVPGVRPKAAVAALGIVTQVDDPEGLGRVKVTLPTYGDIETDWMCVLAPGAGIGKGLVALPDIDDQVFVLFVRNDPTQGVVMGGLYGEKEGLDWGVDQQAVKRYTFQTREGQLMRFDDSQKSIRLETRDGSYIELSPKKMVMHSAVDLEIEAPGRAVTVRGQNIDFQRG